MVLFASCGPPLTDPSPRSISGRWTSGQSVGPVYEIHLDLSQSADGRVKGDWSGKVLPPNPACPPGLGATPTGPVNGRNTNLEVQLSVLGVGDFEGQIVDDKTLTGGLLSCGSIYPITFSLVGPIPAGASE